MAFADELYKAAAPIWEAQLKHPFVQGLGDGSLPGEAFARWLRQDYLFLTDYARLLAWAAAKADTLDSMGWFASMLHLTLHTEMALHKQYAARYGLDARELEGEARWPTTQAYTDFLVRTAAEGDLADAVAVLMPCWWGYVYIAQRLARARRRGGSEGEYDEWIDQYSSAEFVKSAEWLKQELNRLTQGSGSDKKKRLTELFLLSSRYEFLFWEMCWQGEEWPA
ncbi:MAG TPA: thiaminase II [Vicinamibacteria bacterium]|nr:thiaminase II [Vicinamibacteria bacterium]